MKLKISALLIAAACLLSAFGGYRLGRQKASETDENARADTLLIRDTIRITEPVFVARTRIRTDTVRLALVDTVRDTVRVAVPIEQKTFAFEGGKAWVSGFRTSLDSLYLRKDTVIITTAVMKREKSPRWSIGPSAGAGWTPRGIQPFVGITLHYDLFRFDAHKR